ncbi:MAG: YhcN/YlaJ family sporulation lipoprotein [Bacillota bacterium]
MLRNKKIHRIVAAIATLVLSVTIAAGCTEPARRPLPPTPMKPRTSPFTPAPSGKPIANTPAEAHRLAQTLAKEARKVPGVRKAIVVVSGDTAFVGLDLTNDVEAPQSDRIKNEVATRLRKAEGRISTVMVATDPDTITRLNNIAAGIKNGKPVSSFTSQLAEIARRLTPITR